MDRSSCGKKQRSKKKNYRFRKHFQVETDKTKELDHAGTLELEHVLGLTVFSNSALTSDPLSGLVAYPAGCVLVLLDCVKFKQLGTLHTPRRSITAAKFSPDGRYVLTGESGLHPAVRVWELSSMTEVATLRGHSVGIISVSFSPRMREIIVVGDAQDMMISVWSWPSKIMKTLNKFADEIYAMAVAEDSSFFTTVGNRHVKFYYLDNLRALPPHIGNNCPIPLPTRCGILDNLKENCFCDVVCGRGCSSLYIFVVAMSGILCQINRDRYLERWVNVNMINACCLAADENCIFVGGTQGVIRMFRALDLQIITTLPRPHILGLDISQVTTSYIEDISDDASSTLGEDSKEKEPANQYPTTRAITYDSCHEILTVVYGDRSAYIWSRCRQEVDGSEVYYFSKKYSAMYHRGCVWGLTTYPAVLDSDPEEVALGGALPPGALISVSADETLRVWDVCANICEESILKRNCLSAECLKIVYADKIETTRKIRQQTKPREGSFVRHGKQSFSAVTVCPDGLHIATGNQHGRVCIYDTNTMKVMTTMLAHESEVTALGYSITKRYKVLASGSRDRMIHVMDASHGYQLLTTLDDHSSTITAINFTYIARCILMVTSSLDMSVLIRAYLDSNVFSFKPVRAIVEKKSVVDFAINHWSGLIALACQDRFVRVYSIISSVDSTTYRGCPSHGGQLVRIEIDPSGQYLLTACSNRTINLLQFNSGHILNTFYGHAESITSIKFSHNMKHIISSAIDGCIFLWRLPESVTYTVKREMAEMGRLTRGMVLGERWKKSRLVTNVLSVGVRPEPEPDAVREKTSEMKVSMNHVSEHDQNYKTQCEESAYLNTTAPAEEHTVDGDNSIVINTVADKTSNLWTPVASEVSVALPLPRDDRTNNKAWETPGQNSQAVHTYGNNHIPSNSLSPASEAWLSACYERRRIFKLEAKSIKKILAMMRLVTDAMEKDLAGNNWLMYSGAGLGSSSHLPHTYYGSDVVSKRMGMMVPVPLRSQQQQSQQHQHHQQQQQPDKLNSAHRSVSSATQLSAVASKEYPQQQQQQKTASTKWKSDQDSQDSNCRFSQQQRAKSSKWKCDQDSQDSNCKTSLQRHQQIATSKCKSDLDSQDSDCKSSQPQLRRSKQKALKPHKPTSVLSFWRGKSQPQKDGTKRVHGHEYTDTNSLGTGTGHLLTRKRLEKDISHRRHQTQPIQTRIPIRIGSGLLNRICGSSKGQALESSADNSIISEESKDTHSCCLSAVESYHYLLLPPDNSGEQKISPEIHSFSSESFLFEPCLHRGCGNAEVHPEEYDSANKLEGGGKGCCVSADDGSEDFSEKLVLGGSLMGSVGERDLVDRVTDGVGVADRVAGEAGVTDGVVVDDRETGGVCVPDRLTSGMGVADRMTGGFGVTNRVAGEVEMVDGVMGEVGVANIVTGEVFVVDRMTSGVNMTGGVLVTDAVTGGVRDVSSVADNIGDACNIVSFIGDVRSPACINCCLRPEFDNLDFVIQLDNTTRQNGISENLNKPATIAEDTSGSQNGKAVAEMTNSFEDFFNSVAILEAISDDLPSVCELVNDDDDDEDNDEVIFEEINIRGNFANDFSANPNCFISGLSCPVFSECSRVRFSSSAEVLCGEAGVLIENKERCFGSGDGSKVSDSKYTDVCIPSCQTDGVNFSPTKPVICNRVQSNDTEDEDSVIKSPSIVVFDKILEEVE